MNVDSQSTATPNKPQHLNERQLEVWRALRSKAKADYPLHDWYAGALAVMASADESNPDRLAQAANSLREVLQKLPRALETEVLGPDRNIFEQRRKSMVDAITRAKSHYQNGWTGEITKELSAALQQVEDYTLLRGSPTRAERKTSDIQSGANHCRTRDISPSPRRLCPEMRVSLSLSGGR